MVISNIWAKIRGKPPRVPGSTRGKKRKSTSYRSRTAPVARHGGHRKKLPSHFSGGVAAHQSHSGKKRRFSFWGKGEGFGMVATKQHSGSRRKISGVAVTGVAHSGHSGKKRKMYRVRAVDGFSHNPHQGKKRRKNPPENSKALLRQRHQGRRRPVSQMAGWVGMPQSHHTGSKRNGHKSRVVTGEVSGNHSGSRRNKHKSSGEFGVPHVAHSGSRRNKHKSSGEFGVPHVSHSGSRRNKHKSSGEFGVPHVSHSGSGRNKHKGFRGYAQGESYRPGVFSLFQGKHNVAKVPAYQKSVKYKVKAKGRRYPVATPSYNAGTKKYKPKQMSVKKNIKQNATAERMRKMAYLHKSSKGKKRKLDDRGKYQGHVSFNQFLRVIIVILSALVVISLFILMQTKDVWMDSEVETTVVEEKISKI